MKICNLKTNHIKNPMGFDFSKVILSYMVSDTKGKKQKYAQIKVASDSDFSNIIFDSGKSSKIDCRSYELKLELKACTRYYWNISVWADNEDFAISDIAWFETAKINSSWTGKWITPNFNKNIHPNLLNEFNIDKKPVSARAYVCGLGLYEIMINNEKSGSEFLTPGFNAYNKWVQYQTYDITENIKMGKNVIEVLLGNGMYKGRFGYEKDVKEIYGEKFVLLAEIVINFEDGECLVINTDKNWKARKSKIIESNIYDGEVYDGTFDNSKLYDVSEIDIGYENLKARLSIPVVIKEELKPAKVIKTPLKETVLDMEQNMVGWIKFKSKLPKGTQIKIQFGEVLQDECFYRDNLRSAKAEYIYISDGIEREVRPHFTFYGFRYVKLSGFPYEINKDDFTGCVLYSDMDRIGNIETDDSLLNRLFLNSLWGQKGNFIDVPTDCPQRDERLGWTGDAQVYSGTACFNMDSYAFFNKYMFDMLKEQEERDGVVPMFVPSLKKEGSSSAWGDAATIIPWNLYLHYGDKSILENCFNNMKLWVDYIRRVDDNAGGKRLWDKGFHFGDWLSLDGNPETPMGGTDVNFISSAYYAYSSTIVSKAAYVLGLKEIGDEYNKLSKEIKQAIVDEYISKNGRLGLDTQTGYVLALYMDLIPSEFVERTVNDFVEQLKADRIYLKTGFVGTPYICRVLSEYGYNDLAYKLLLNKDYPSWLYPVTLGATTIWERWNSVLPDGKISGTNMNSLNHYAYGSIVEWMYRNMAGLNPDENNPGFKHVLLKPKPNFKIKYLKAKLNSPFGLYQSEWRILDDGKLNFKFTLPFDTTAEVILPDVEISTLYLNGKLVNDMEIDLNIKNKTVKVNLDAGEWEFDYYPVKSYLETFSIDTCLTELFDNKEAKKILLYYLPQFENSNSEIIHDMAGRSLKEAANNDLIPVDKNLLKIVDEKLKKL